MTELSTTAPAFVDMAHRIVWATVATVEPDGQPRTRVLHPIWEWDDNELVGWIATGPDTPKARHLDAEPRISLTYWDPTQDTCTAECATTWLHDADDKAAAWNRFLDAPEPVGYDPSIIPGWTSPDVPAFGVIRLQPTRLRVFPGTLLLQGEGHLLTWNDTSG
ncbi:MAG: pyridoxamine 5'-phosphate oxidase family protein [Ilumatobacter sp.]|uniref:pyridoxamine 5'-phosphate oxidase family protein n=1 Tax=Ilumatobacter sp. TaxID=1967498 RepID=UPI003C7880C0